MAANTRIRIEPDLEDYLRSQAERVIGKSGSEISGAEITTIANRLLYEHKIAQSMVKHEFLPKLFSWVKTILPNLGNGKVVSIGQAEQPALKASEKEKEQDFDFAADFATQFDEEEAA
jgi:hypothetical protein